MEDTGSEILHTRSLQGTGGTSEGWPLKDEGVVRRGGIIYIYDLY